MHGIPAVAPIKNIANGLMSAILACFFGVLPSCDKPEAGEPAITTSLQELRASSSESGPTYVAMNILATDKEGKAIPCGKGLLDVTLEIGDGPGGPWQEVPSKDIEIKCDKGGGDFALVIDNSGSQGGYLEKLKEAGKALVAHSVTSQGGRASLIRVSTDADVVTPMTSDAQQINSAIDELFISNGWTALYDGIRLGNETLGDAHAGSEYSSTKKFCSAASHKGIVVFTDGYENNSSGQKIPQKYNDGIDTYLDDLHNLQVDGITTPIYTIGLGGNVNHSGLTALADKTGGRHFRISSADQIAERFGSVAEYLTASHNICTELPTDRCGPLSVRVSWTWSHGKDVYQGSKTESINVKCPIAPTGRVATILLTLTNPQSPTDLVEKLPPRAVRWAGSSDSPRVLVLLDDNHHSEFAKDAQAIHQALIRAGLDAEYAVEPEAGLGIEAFDGYDVVWLSNPGHPPDDLKTLDALAVFSEEGGGVVLQGDDMASAWGHNVPMTDMTRLQYKDNGTTYCGKRIDNNANRSYEVSLDGLDHPMLAGIGIETFLYGDDIDTTVPVPGVLVLSTATLGDAADCPRKPVIAIWER